MAHNPVFFGHVSAAGKLEPNAHEKPEIARHLKSLAGEPVEFQIRKRRSKRSLDQNSWLWRSIRILAEHCGYDEHEHERLHYEILAVRFGTKEVAGLVPGGPTLVVPQRTSSDLNTQEFSEYMEWLVRWGATELNCVIPLPSERKDDAA